MQLENVIHIGKISHVHSNENALALKNKQLSKKHAPALPNYPA
jgi:hypothetical protein